MINTTKHISEGINGNGVPVYLVITTNNETKATIWIEYFNNKKEAESWVKYS